LGKNNNRISRAANQPEKSGQNPNFNRILTFWPEKFKLSSDLAGILISINSTFDLTTDGIRVS
jgi:hypothetical protein